MEIDEVKAYIESEKHLPWVTSSQNEEENAVNMTRMGFETLEALENLQMQIIKLNREVKQLREENSVGYAHNPIQEKLEIKNYELLLGYS